MSLLNLESSKEIPQKFPLFNLGFRPFFLGAGLFGFIGMLVWLLMLQGLLTLPIAEMTTMQWHGHEMIFGFTIAVAAGFLLAAVKNWTGLDTLSGWPLAVLFLLWLGARIGWFIPNFAPELGSISLLVTATFDLLFNLYFMVAFAQPIFISKQWKQVGLLSKVILMGIFNLVFYLGLFGILENGITWGIYGGFFVILALILTMGRRVIPFFIERGVPENITIQNPKWIDHSSLGLFLLLALSELFANNAYLSALFALLLLIVGGLRLKNWYSPGIWKKPILWSLYLGMVFIQFGFLLYVVAAFQTQYHSLAIHTLAIGGMGLITLGMMTRVSLGHTGRNINQPPRYHGLTLAFIIIATLIRVVMPALFSEYYTLWIMLSQIVWIMAFAIFSWSFIPMLLQKRIDGHFG